MTASPARLQFFRASGARNAVNGYYDHTPFWDEQAERFYLHPTARRFIGQIGRGGIKSGTALDFAATELVAGDWKIAPGERHYFAWVSESLEEAAQRPRQLEAKLRALGVPCERIGNTVEIDGLPVGFKAFACRVGAVSGFRCIGFVADEEAKWSSADDGANPAREVIASLRAMCVTHRDAREWHISSPLSKVDYHFEQFAQGDNDVQVVANAPSWTANPGITEQQTRDLERDARIWAREYAAIPQAAISAAFEQDDVLRAFGPFPAGYKPSRWVMLVDPSGGGRDSWAFGLAAWCLAPRAPEFLTERKYVGRGVEYEDYMRDEAGEPIRNPRFEADDKPPVLRIARYGGFANARASGWTVADIVTKLSRELCRPNHVGLVYGDRFEAFALSSEFPRHGLEYRFHHWSNATKGDAVSRVSSWLRDGLISFSDSEPTTAEMRRQLLSFDMQIRRSGAVTFSGRGTTADDLVSLALLAAQADSERFLPASPYTPQRRISRASVEAQMAQRFGDRDLGPGPNGARGRWMIDTDGNARGVTFSR